MTRSQDNALRLLLLVAAIGLVALTFVIGSNTSGWATWPRTLVLSISAGAAVGTFWLGIEIRTKYPERTPLRLRRWGILNESGGPNPPVGLGPSSPLHIALDRKNSLFVGGVLVVIAILAWSIAANLDFSEDALPATAIALAVAPWATIYAARAVIRVLLANRAATITSRELVLGTALGYWPPLHLARSAIQAILPGLSGVTSIAVVLEDRIYEINPRHMVDSETVVARMHAAWPDRAAQVTWETDISDDAEVAQQEVSQAPPEVVALATKSSRRRRALAMLVLIVGIGLLGTATAWYLVQRAANDALLSEGKSVLARVDEVDRSSRGPDELKVSFEVDGERHQAIIHSGWFTGWKRSAQGQDVVVLVDPDSPQLVRLPEARNIHVLTWIALMVALVVAIIAFAQFKEKSTIAALLREGQWGRRVVRIKKSNSLRRTLSVRALSDGPEDEPWVSLGANATGRPPDGEWSVWSCENEASILVVLDDTSHVVALAKKKQLSSTSPQ